MPPSLARRCAAEVFGTFWLVFGGVGSAVLAAAVEAGELSINPILAGTERAEDDV